MRFRWGERSSRAQLSPARVCVSVLLCVLYDDRENQLYTLGRKSVCRFGIFGQIEFFF